MRIAQIAPLFEAVPPKLYGGTERVVYSLTEELVAMGHDVTLFAPGDSSTSAKLVAFFPKSLIAEGAPWQAALKPYYHLAKSLERLTLPIAIRRGRSFVAISEATAAELRERVGK